MAQLRRDPDQGNVNVTLGPWGTGLEDLNDKEFPCPLCGTGLSILATKRNKPYCTCNQCGVQLFIRRKEGIARLVKMAHVGILVSGIKVSASYAITLYNRLEQLRLQKKRLENKQGFFSRDENLTNAISLVSHEIENVEGELVKLAKKTSREKKK
jgi:hypothetical protein